MKHYPFFREEDEETLAVIGEEAAASDLVGTYQKPYAVLTQKRLYCKNEAGNFITEAGAIRSTKKAKAKGAAWVPLAAVLCFLLAVTMATGWGWLGLHYSRDDQRTIEQYEDQKAQLGKFEKTAAELEKLDPVTENQNYEALLQQYSAAQEKLEKLRQGEYEEIEGRDIAQVMKTLYEIDLYGYCGTRDPDGVAQILTAAYEYAEDTYGIDPNEVIPVGDVDGDIFRGVLDILDWHQEMSDAINLINMTRSITENEIADYIKYRQAYLDCQFNDEHIIYDRLSAVVQDMLGPSELHYDNIWALRRSAVNTWFSRLVDTWYSGNYTSLSSGKEFEDYRDGIEAPATARQKYVYSQCVWCDFIRRSYIAYLGLLGIVDLPQSEEELQALVYSYPAQIAEAEAVQEQIRQYCSALGVSGIDGVEQKRQQLQNGLDWMESQYQEASAAVSRAKRNMTLAVVLDLAAGAVMVIVLLLWNRKRTVYQITHTTGAFHFTPSLYPASEFKAFTAQVERLKAEDRTHA